MRPPSPPGYVNLGGLNGAKFSTDFHQSTVVKLYDKRLGEEHLNMKIIPGIFAAALLLPVTPSFAADTGRYQLVFSHTGGAAFLVDTATGRVWSPESSNNRLVWRLNGKDDAEPPQQQSR